MMQHASPLAENTKRAGSSGPMGYFRLGVVGEEETVTEAGHGVAAVFGDGETGPADGLKGVSGDFPRSDFPHFGRGDFRDDGDGTEDPDDSAGRVTEIGEFGADRPAVPGIDGIRVGEEIIAGDGCDFLDFRIHFDFLRFRFSFSPPY